MHAADQFLTLSFLFQTSRFLGTSLPKQEIPHQLIARSPAAHTHPCLGSSPAWTPETRGIGTPQRHAINLSPCCDSSHNMYQVAQLGNDPRGVLIYFYPPDPAAALAFSNSQTACMAWNVRYKINPIIMHAPYSSIHTAPVPVRHPVPSSPITSPRRILTSPWPGNFKLL